MSDISSLLSLLLASLVGGSVMTKSLIHIMTSLNIVDEPGMRRAHKKVTPRGGGLALVILFCFLFPLWEYLQTNSFGYSITILQIFLPIAVISLWDDIIGISVSFRLFIHLLCSVLTIMWLVHPNKVLGEDVPILIDLCLATIALATFLNVYNFMDGIDGISASQSIHMSITILILCFLNSDTIPNIGFIVPTMFIILGWSVSFLIFNWQPAKIFLGDVGSISLGFLLGSCLLMIASSSLHLFLSCIITTLYYIADGGLTILIRLMNGEKIWQPHLNHFFQRAVRNGLSHSKVVKRIILCNICLMFCAIACVYYPITSTITALLVVVYTLNRLE